MTYMYKLVFLVGFLSLITRLNALGIVISETTSNVKELQYKLSEMGDSVDDFFQLYLQLATCVSYETEEDFISIGIEIEQEIPNQFVNIVVIDDKFNLIRRSELKNKESKFGFGFNGQFIYICFENYRINQSWKVKPIDMFLLLDIKFGVIEINKEVQNSNLMMNKLTESYLSLIDELNKINEFWINLHSIEKELRDLNEVILDKISIYYMIIILTFICVSIYQIQWVLNIIKNGKIYLLTHT